MKVSVIIPYKEDRGYLQDAIRSVEVQTYPDIELILSKGDGNAAYNFNRGLQRATGDLIKKLDSDDWLTPDSIELSVQGMRGYDITHGNAYMVERGIKKYKSRVEHPTTQSLLRDSSMHGITAMYRKDLFDKVGVFDHTLDMAQEYEFHLRALQKGSSIGYINSYLGYYRIHDKMISASDSGKRKQVLKNIKSRFLAYNIKQATKKKVIWVDPRSIKLQAAFYIEESLLPHTHIAGGVWPTADLHKRQAFVGIYERYVLGKRWEDTAYYGSRVVGAPWKGKNIKEYFDALDILYTSMKEKGYIHRHKGWKYSEYSTLEIGVVKKGNEIIWCHDGQHRLAIAQLLGIKKVPVRVILEQ